MRLKIIALATTACGLLAAHAAAAYPLQSYSKCMKNNTWHVITRDLGTTPPTRIGDKDTGQPCVWPGPQPDDDDQIALEDQNVIGQEAGANTSLFGATSAPGFAIGTALRPQIAVGADGR